MYCIFKLNYNKHKVNEVTLGEHIERVCSLNPVNNVLLQQHYLHQNHHHQLADSRL